MDLVSTRDKLNEARWFLNHLRAERRGPTQNPPEVFRYYHSAYLNAAYSVTEYLKTEVKRELKEGAEERGESRQQAKAKYSEIYDQWVSKLSTDDGQIWEIMTSGRGQEAHTSRIQTKEIKKYVPIDQGRALPYYQPLAVTQPVHFRDLAMETKRELGLPPWVDAWRVAYEHHFEIKGELPTVVTVCEQYLALLEELVKHVDQEASKVRRLP